MNSSPPGAQVLEVDHKTDPVTIKDAARHKTCLLGNIDTNLLQSGTPEEVDEACRELIEVWKPDSGFILGPGCAMGSTVPADNVHALVESAKKYGVYAYDKVNPVSQLILSIFKEVSSVLDNRGPE